MAEWMEATAQVHDAASPFQLWELCSGSSALSAAARTKSTSHLPPVYYRYGWSLSRAADQIAISYAIMFVGVAWLFMSPILLPVGGVWGRAPEASYTIGYVKVRIKDRGRVRSSNINISRTKPWFY